MNKYSLICGGGGFIGHHLAKRLKTRSKVICVDIKDEKEVLKYTKTQDFCDTYIQLDLSKEKSWNSLKNILALKPDIYQLAADMGGAGYIFSGENDANVMHNSALINLLCAEYATKNKAKVFYSSSACMYPSYNQTDPNNPKCSEDSAYPASPDSEYGWEKLFSERLYLAYNRNYGLDVKIARFHNIFGEEGAWNNGKEKAPAALCRKIALAKDIDVIDIWGSGEQTRSFLYIEDCLDAIELLISHPTFIGPVNIGSEEMVTINSLASMIASVANKTIKLNNIPGPVGVMGRNSDNNLIRKELNWSPKYDLIAGIKKTYAWIEQQVSRQKQ